ncbi:MAG: hypothetical protein IKL29_03625 [Bacteroidaceae bacterium]|nr:hypothetical protein [Bacteroidaceae bacterium]
MNNNLNKTIREQRKEAVIKTFFETVKKMSASNPCVTNKEILAKAVNEEAPRFFINYESARRFISLMARKKKLPVVNKNKLAMYKEIYRRYKERNKGDEGHYKTLEKILEEPAPSFYLDESTFQGIVYKTLRERNTTTYA